MDDERKSFGSRLKHAWNAFTSQTVEDGWAGSGGVINYGRPPSRSRAFISNERSIISSIFTRMSIDTASVDIRHVRTDDDGRYKEDIDSGINNCLTLEANLDQAARAFRQDIAMTLFENGVVAIVPVDTTLNPKLSGSYDIQTMRVGTVVAWMSDKVRVSLWNVATQRREELTLDKSYVAIVENPLYSVMNEPNSTLQRLIRKLNILDAIDEQSGSGKLDVIIQLPYVIRSESRRQQAEQRRKDIEFQLSGSKYGIAYTDGTEKITQLNRPVENNLLGQVQFLTQMLYGQLGITEEVMNGTADEPTMINYNNRTIEPVIAAIVEAMRRTFLTKTARTQNQTIMSFRDPFRLLPLSEIAEIADAFSRNEILASNEIRQAIGYKPSSDPAADKLQNSNMPKPGDSGPPTDPGANLRQMNNAKRNPTPPSGPVDNSSGRRQPA